MWAEEEKEKEEEPGNIIMINVSKWEAGEFGQ